MTRPLKSHLETKPPEFDELNDVITQDRQQPGNNKIQEHAFKLSLKYMKLYGEDRHCFCDPYLRLAASHLMILFSFPLFHVKDAILPSMAKAIGSCGDCIREFSLAKIRLYHTYCLVKGTPVGQVNQFIDAIFTWQVDIMYPEIMKLEKLIGDNGTIPLEQAKYVAGVLLWEPLFLADPRTSACCNRVLFHIISNYKHYLIYNYYPGIIHLYILNLNPVLIDFVDNCIKSKSDHIDSRPQDVTATNGSFEHAFSRFLYQLQDAKYYNEEFCDKFWHFCIKLVNVLQPQYFIDNLNCPPDIEIMSKFNDISYVPIIVMLHNHLRASVKRPAKRIIQFFTCFLSTFKLKTWIYTKPFIYVNSLDFVLQHSNFKSLDDSIFLPVLDWIPEFCNSLTGTPKNSSIIKICQHLFNMKNDPRFNTAMLTVIGILREVFNSPGLSLNNTNLEVDILSTRDIRALVDVQAAQILDHLRVHESINTELTTSVMDLIVGALSYDTLILTNNTRTIIKGDTPRMFDSFPILWKSLSSAKVSSSTDFMKLLITKFTILPHIVEFIPRKMAGGVNAVLPDHMKAHNGQIHGVIDGIISEVENISMLDSQYSTTIINNKDSLKGLWAAMFFPPLTQSCLDIIYQAFDVQGRLEGIQKLILHHLGESLDSICYGLTALTELQAFEPCPKAVRLCMDIIHASLDPATGILNSQGRDSDNKPLPEYVLKVQNLWSSCWKFLAFIYKKTLEWANYFHLNDLVEFTRDNLDVSHLLVDSLRYLIDFVQTSNQQSPLLIDLFETFNHVIVWLRLGDTSLLSSCVDLVFKGLDVAQQYKYPVSTSFLTLFIKYGLKAKKFNNKLSDQQRSAIVTKARTIDDNLVETLIAEVVKQNEAKTKLATVAKGMSSSSSSNSSSTQQTLSKFGVVTKDPPVAPPPKTQFKSGSLDDIRKELKGKRKGLSNSPATVIHEPRPAGFNSKKPVAVGRSMNQLRKRPDEDNSDDEQEGDDVDMSDLFVDKKKKAKIVELDMNGVPVTKVINAKSKANREREEQERMRLRLYVNLKSLYTKILRWNFNSTSEFPTDTNLEKVKNEYDDISLYVKSIEPLLLLEGWQGIQSAKQRSQEQAFKVFIGRRVSCDGFFELNCSIPKHVANNLKLSDTDLIVLSQVDDSQIEVNRIPDYIKSPTTLTCLGKINEMKYSFDSVDVTIRVSTQGDMLRLLTPNSVVYAMKVMTMTTLEREYSSLFGLQYYDLCDDILKARPALPQEIDSSTINSVKRSYDLNTSQARAIISSHGAKGFSLIQGPPGTGKTKTILGLVGYGLNNNKAGQIVTANDSSKENRILICAPSNAAVDELVVRIKDGVRDSKGNIFTPSVVRLGRSDAVNSAVRDLTLEELVDRQLAASLPESKSDGKLRAEHTRLTEERTQINKKLQGGNVSSGEVEQLESQLRTISRERHLLAQKLDEERDKMSIHHRTKEIERRQAQAKILGDAQIICSTLSGSAHDFMVSMSMKFNKIIVDEACQCVELSAIIPLRYGCTECVMVGDPNQLPPTVLSQTAASYNYDQSLFVRMQRLYPERVNLLDIQYRMHPQISQFPSLEFYDGNLKDGDGIVEKNTRPWHQYPVFSPYIFFNTIGKHEKDDISRSFFNSSEARVALELVEKLFEFIPDGKITGKIGIISPYKEQIKILKNTFVRRFGQIILKEIDFNTVDGFQGQEKDIIIMSCVRASETGNVGFLSDIRRMNVALTRAKSTLWVLGDAKSLSRDKHWNNLINNANQRQAVITAKPGFLGKVELKKDIEVKEVAKESGSGGTEPKQPETKDLEPKESEPKQPEPKQLEPKQPETKPKKSVHFNVPESMNENNPPEPKPGISSNNEHNKPSYYSPDKLTNNVNHPQSKSHSGAPLPPPPIPPPGSNNTINPTKSGFIPPKRKTSSLFIPNKRRP